MAETTITETGNSDERCIKAAYVFDKVAGYSPGLAHLRQKLGIKAKNEPKFKFYSLYTHVYHIETLRTAWKLIRQNGQSPGIDKITYEDIEQTGDIEDPTMAAIIAESNVENFLKEIQEELKSRTYKTRPIRRLYIPKADGKKRPLGLPTIRDRLVQMAVVLIIEPIFEQDFLDSSYGFRPNKSAHDAIKEIADNLRYGRIAIYDADLKTCFDSIPHEELIKCIRMRITDGSVLKLIEMWLKAPIVEKDKDDKGNWKITVTRPLKGTMQGGVISPLLANVYLHWFDKRFHSKDGPRQFANARLIRYADDFVIMAKYMGKKITDSVKYLIEDWLKLEINKEKTRIINLKGAGDSMDFLGFTFRLEESRYKDGTYVRIEPKKKAIEKAMDAIRLRTSRSKNHLPIKEVIGNMNAFLHGWKGYFKFGHPDRIFRKMDYFVGIKMKRHLNRRSQRKYNKPKGETWYAHLAKLGMIRISDKSRLKPSF